MSPIAFIGFGANLGDRQATFLAVCDALHAHPAVTVKRASSLYETTPVGISDNGPDFLNGVIMVETDLEPHRLLEILQDIEQVLGKDPLHRSDRSRVVDLDLLLYGGLVKHGEKWQIPHPRMHKRAFVLVPLHEVAPWAYVPDVGCTVNELLRQIPKEQQDSVRLFASSVWLGG